MQRLAAIILCISTQAAFAQCVAPVAPVAATTNEMPSHVSAPAQRAAATTPSTNTRSTPELIKTAAAGTRDDAPPTVHATPHGDQDGQDHPRRGGTAMLLAALALMSGIALRRYGASNT